VKRVVVDVISCYKKLLREKFRARQSTLDAFFKEDVPEPESIFPPVAPIFFPNAAKFTKFGVGTLTYYI
jgi:hypothetical protein